MDTPLQCRVEMATGAAAVESHDLLASRMDATGENPALGRRCVGPVTYESSGTNPLFAQALQHSTTSLVVTDHTDGDRSCPECAEIGHAVCRATGGEDAPGLVQDQNRGLTRNPVDVPEDELVGDQIAEHGDGLPAKLRNPATQPLGSLLPCTHDA